MQCYHSSSQGLYKLMVLWSKYPYQLSLGKTTHYGQSFGTYVRDTVDILFCCNFNDCDHSSLTDNMFTALKSC